MMGAAGGAHLGRRQVQRGAAVLDERAVDERDADVVPQERLDGGGAARRRREVQRSVAILRLRVELRARVEQRVDRGRLVGPRREVERRAP